MDCKDYKLDDIKSLLNLCNDDFIINFANKGLLKRANKEIDKGVEVKIEVLGDEEIEIVFDEDTKCLVKPQINDIGCTCKAKGVCKHIVTSILILRDELSKEVVNQDREGSIQEDVIHNTENLWIKNVKIDEIVDKLKPNNIRDILFRLNYNMDYGVEKNNYKVQVRIYDNIIITAPFIGDIDNMLCSLRCDGLCHHKVEALLICLINENIYDKQDVINTLVRKFKNDKHIRDDKCLVDVNKLTRKMLEVGLARLPKTILNEIEYEVHRCTRLNYPRLEKMLKSLITTINRYYSKDASFSNSNYIRQLIKIALVTKAIDNAVDYKVLTDAIGVKKTTYVPISDLCLFGIGALGWTSNSNYQGITYYFYDDDNASLYSYNDVMPTETTKSNSIKRMYNKTQIWSLEAPMKDLCRKKIKIKKPRINEQNRLSSSNDTEGFILDKTEMSKLKLEKLLYRDFSQLIEHMKDSFTFTIRKKDELESLVIVEVDKYDEPHFDEINQQLRVDMYDENKEVLTMLIQYNEHTDYLIKAIERTYKNGGLGYRLLGKVFKYEDSYYISPITFYYENDQMENVTIELR